MSIFLNQKNTLKFLNLKMAILSTKNGHFYIISRNIVFHRTGIENVPKWPFNFFPLDKNEYFYGVLKLEIFKPLLKTVFMTVFKSKWTFPKSAYIHDCYNFNTKLGQTLPLNLANPLGGGLTFFRG